MFDYRFVNESSKQYRALDKDTKRRVNAALETISESPFRGGNIRKLQGRQNEYRCRVGRYRIVYHVDKENRMRTILGILPRNDAYFSRRSV